MKIFSLIKSLTYIILIGLLSSCSTGKSWNNRYDWEKNFIENQQNFKDLIEYADEIFPQSDNYLIQFGLGRNGSISLHLVINEDVITQDNVISLSEVYLNSEKLKSVIKYLDWDEIIISNLRKKLQKTGCDWIRNTEADLNPIKIYKNPSGFSNFSYVVYSEADIDYISDLFEIKGYYSIGDQGFAKRVYLISSN